MCAGDPNVGDFRDGDQGGQHMRLQYDRRIFGYIRNQTLCLGSDHLELRSLASVSPLLRGHGGLHGDHLARHAGNERQNVRGHSAGIDEMINSYGTKLIGMELCLIRIEDGQSDQRGGK